MGDLADAVKAPVIVTVAGTEYTISPLVLRDFGELQRWQKSQIFQSAAREIEALGSVATPQVRDSLIARAEKEADQVVLGGESKDKAIPPDSLTLLETTGRLLWMSLRKTLPDLTYDDTLALITIDTLPEWQDALDEAMSAAEKSGENGERPTEEAAT